MKKVVIIGNGIAGITCARYVRKLSNYRIIVVSAESDHFFSRTALMYIYMGHMKYENTKPYEDAFWPKNRIELVRAYVEKVDTGQKELILSDGKKLPYDVLVIATGSEPNTFDWPGKELKGVQGLYSLQDLENMKVYTKGITRGVVVGGGLIGIEMAEMLLSGNIQVTFLVREQSFWNSILPPEESDMITKHILEHGVDLKLSTQLKEIIGDENGRVKAVITTSGENIPCQFVGLAIGVHPNISFLEKSGIEKDRGILVNEYFETNVPDVYAIGDCAQYKSSFPGRKAVEQVWYTGRIHGETVAKTICGKQTPYQPGLWFNSAKFFDIEYQVYGTVPNNDLEGIDSLFWQHQDGQKSIRIVYRSDTKRVIGFNLLGVRYRQEICESLINGEKELRYVLTHLNQANFDPEFHKKYENELITSYNWKHPEEAPLQKKKKGLFWKW